MAKRPIQPGDTVSDRRGFTLYHVIRQVSDVGETPGEPNVKALTYCGRWIPVDMLSPVEHPDAQPELLCQVCQKARANDPRPLPRAE